MDCLELLEKFFVICGIIILSCFAFWMVVGTIYGVMYFCGN